MRYPTTFFTNPLFTFQNLFWLCNTFDLFSIFSALLPTKDRPGGRGKPFATLSRSFSISLQPYLLRQLSSLIFLPESAPEGELVFRGKSRLKYEPLSPQDARKMAALSSAPRPGVDRDAPPLLTPGGQIKTKIGVSWFSENPRPL